MTRLLHTTTISTFESVICVERDRKIEILFLSVAYARFVSTVYLPCPATLGTVYDQVKMIVYEDLIYLLDYIIVDGLVRRYLASHIISYLILTPIIYLIKTSTALHDIALTANQKQIQAEVAGTQLTLSCFFSLDNTSKYNLYFEIKNVLYLTICLTIPSHIKPIQILTD